jgi:hypothetical protein
MSFPARLLTALILTCATILPTALQADDQADLDKASRAAETFINDYCSTGFADQHEVVKWVNKREDVFPIFKERLSKLYLDALKQDPEVGYGADAILSTIEEGGNKYRTVDTFYGRAHITVTLRAIAPAGCTHEVRVVMMEKDGRWLVQSCGDVPM